MGAQALGPQNKMPRGAGPAEGAGGLERICFSSWPKHSGHGCYRRRPHKPLYGESSSAYDCHAAGGALGEDRYIFPAMGLRAQGHGRLSLVFVVSIIHYGNILLLTPYHLVARPIATQDGSGGLLVRVARHGGQTQDRVATGAGGCIRQR